MRQCHRAAGGGSVITTGSNNDVVTLALNNNADTVTLGAKVPDTGPPADRRDQRTAPQHDDETAE